MATAPKPGVGRRAEQTETAKTMVTIEYEGTTLSLAWKNLPMTERLTCRKATGLPFETFSEPLGADGANVIGEDSLFVVWWFARRAHGEPGLEYETAVAEWDVAKVGAIDVDIPDAKGEDPEA